MVYAWVLSLMLSEKLQDLGAHILTRKLLGLFQYLAQGLLPQ